LQAIALGAVLNRRRQSEKEGLSRADILRQGGRGSSDADVHTFWCKTSDFSKFMVCPHGQEG